MKIHKLLLTCILFFLWSSLSGCSTSSSTPLFELTTIPPTAPSSLSELLFILENGSDDARISASLAILSRGKEDRLAAIPILIENLSYEDNSEVRKITAIVLGELGPEAQIGVQELVQIVNTDIAVKVRVVAAEALGKIGDRSSVPALVGSLNSDNLELIIVSAKSIGILVGEEFTDINSIQGYVLSTDGTPLIVLDAKKWWEEEGKYDDWEENN